MNLSYLNPRIYPSFLHHISLHSPFSIFSLSPFFGFKLGSSFLRFGKMGAQRPLNSHNLSLFFSISSIFLSTFFPFSWVLSMWFYSFLSSHHFFLSSAHFSLRVLSSRAHFRLSSRSFYPIVSRRLPIFVTLRVHSPILVTSFFHIPHLDFAYSFRILISPILSHYLTWLIDSHSFSWLIDSH